MRANTHKRTAVIRFEKSFERDILSAWTSTKDEAFQKKLQVFAYASAHAIIIQ